MSRVVSATALGGGLLVLLAGFWWCMDSEVADLASASHDDHPGTVPRSAPPLDRQGASPEREGEAQEVDAPACEAEPTLVLDVATLRPPVGTTWCFSSTAETDRELTRSVSSSGHVDLPYGSWTCRSLDPGYRPVHEHLDVGPSVKMILWVQRAGKCVVSVQTREGAPLPGAEVAVISGPPAAGFPMRFPKWPAPAQTRFIADAEGLVPFDPFNAPISIVTARAEGYRPKWLRLVGPPPEKLTLSLDEERGTRPISFLRVPSDTPCSSVQLATRYEELSVRQDSSGRTEVPSWLLEEGAVRVSGEELCPILVGLEGRSEVRIPAAARLDLALERVPPGQTTWVFTSLETTRHEYDGRVDFPPVARVEGQRAILIAPLDSTLRVCAVASDGSSAEQCIVLASQVNGLTLVLTRGQELRLFVADESGEALADAKASVNYDGYSSVVLGPDEGGVIKVPLPEHAQRITVSCSGFVDRTLAPNTDVEDREGSLSLRMRHSSRLEIALVTEEGRPVPGVQVGLCDRRGRAAFEREPQWHGAWATDHPGWLEKPNLAERAVSDGNGEVTFECLEEAEYSLNFDVPFDLLSGYYGTFFTPCPYAVRPTGSSKETITIPFPRRCSLEAFDGSTGKPMPSFTVWAPGGLESKPVETGNYRWEGWVGSHARFLSVAAIGYESQEVAVEAAEATARVALYPQRSTGVRLIGERLPDLVGEEILVVGWSSSDEFRQIVRKAVGITDPDRIALPLASPGPLEVGIEPLTLDDGWTATFAPRRQRWEDGGTMEFMVQWSRAAVDDDRGRARR